MNKKMKSEEKFNTFLSAFFVIALFGGMFSMIIFLKPMEKFDKQYCYQVQKQADDYRNFLYSHNNPNGFYVTTQDKQMCNDLGIEINAPIK